MKNFPSCPPLSSSPPPPITPLLDWNIEKETGPFYSRDIDFNHA